MPSNKTFSGKQSRFASTAARDGNRLQVALRRWVRFTGSIITTVIACVALISISGDVPATKLANASYRLAQISQDGRLHVAVPTGYLHGFEGGDGLSGLEFDLLKRFAVSRDLSVRLHRVRNSQQAMTLLAAGHVQIAAGGLSQSMASARSLRASIAFLDNRYQVVSADGVGPIHQPGQLVGRRVVVSAGSNSIHMLQALTSANPLLRWQVSGDDSDEDLHARLARREIDATITDTRTALIMQHHYPELNLGYIFADTYPAVWALREDCDPELELVLNQYITRELRHGTVAMLKERYTDPASQQNYLNLIEFRSRVATDLPRYRHMFVDAASQQDSDWRLLAALSYQESMWDPQAESPTGVLGLMQLTQDTADFLKVDRRDPADSINGAARYLARLRSRLPATVQEPDRTWFALASYNLGPGHVDDALHLTAARGGNPDRWIDVKNVLPLLEDPDVAKTTRYGKARGTEALAHVIRVRSFYQVLTRLEDNAEIHYQANITNPVATHPPFVATTTDGRAITASHVRMTQAIDNHPVASFVRPAEALAPEPEAVSYVDVQTNVSRQNARRVQTDRSNVWIDDAYEIQNFDLPGQPLYARSAELGVSPVPDNGLFPQPAINATELLSSENTKPATGDTAVLSTREKRAGKTTTTSASLE